MRATLAHAMTSIVDAASYLFTSESVTEGHPDKMCDQISDAILDAILREDPDARVACETATTTGLVAVLGRDHHDDVRRLPARGPRDGPRDRLHEGRLRLRLPDLRRPGEREGAVARHRPGRRRTGARRGRPGDDVRLRLPRDARAHAPPDRPGPPPRAATRRGAQVGPAAVPPSRRQDPGHRGVRARAAEARGNRRHRGPARPRRAGQPA